jgi:rod shape-determining protein MreC
MIIKDFQAIGISLLLIVIITSPIFTYLGEDVFLRWAGQLFTLEVSSNVNNLEELESKVVKLESEISSLLYLAQENQQLKQILGIKSDSLTVVQAQVVSDDPILLTQSILINKGTKDGVKEGQAVIYLGVLIGRVVNATDSTATVRLLQDSKSSIAAQILRQDQEPIKGVIKPEFGLEIRLDLVPNTIPINIGDAVYTSGLDELPAGILIGHVDSSQEGDLYQKIRINPKVNTHSITQVFVLTP